MRNPMLIHTLVHWGIDALKGQYSLTQGLVPVHPDTDDKCPSQGLITNRTRNVRPNRHRTIDISCETRLGTTPFGGVPLDL